MPHIPNEILFLIFDYINLEPPDNGARPPASRRLYDLSRLLLVCRVWYHVLAAQVYLSLEVNYPQRRLYRLALSLLKNPGLASFVQRLWIGGYSIVIGPTTNTEDNNLVLDPDDDGLLDNPCTRPFHDILIRASPERKERRRWQRDLIRGLPDAWMAVLFFLVPNLRFFKLDHSAGAKIWTTIALSRIATGAVDFPFRPLQFLEEVFVSENSIFASRSHLEFIPFLHFPAMRSFFGHSLTDRPEANHTQICLALPPPHQSSGITRLVLSHIHARPSILRYITACANLLVFKYEHTDDSTGLFPVWTPHYLYKALETQRHSLQVLYVGYWDFSGESFAEVYRMITHRPGLWSFGSLVEFTHLREIDVPVVFFLEYPEGLLRPTLDLLDKLPSSVEKLCLSEILDRDVETIASTLCAMVSARDQYPRLQVIELCLLRLVPENRDGEWFVLVRAAFAALQVKCNAAGMELRYSSHRESRPKVRPGLEKTLFAPVA